MEFQNTVPRVISQLMDFHFTPHPKCRMKTEHLEKCHNILKMNVNLELLETLNYSNSYTFFPYSEEVDFYTCGQKFWPSLAFFLEVG